MNVRFRLLALLALAGCSHLSPAHLHVRARLISISVSGASPGALALVAKYQLHDLPLGKWVGERASLTLSLDDVPFAAVVAQPHLLPGDRMELPIDLAFIHPPRQAAVQWQVGEPVRLRLRGSFTLKSATAEVRFPSDVESALVLPRAAVPPARG